MFQLCSCDKKQSEYLYLCSECYFKLVGGVIDKILENVFSEESKTFEELRYFYKSNPKRMTEFILSSLESDLSDTIYDIKKENEEFYHWKQDKKKGENNV